MKQLEAAALAIALLFSATFTAHAQGGTYPDHPVTLIVPFSAGGDADVAARSLAVVAQQVTGQVHVPVNRAGASGAIGSLAVRNARPDGYTLLLARVGSQVVLPALQPSVGYKWNEFTLLGLLELNPVVCVTRADSPIRSMKDLVEALRARPGKLNYSTSGAATILNFAPQLLFDVLKLGREAAVQIAYKGGSEAALAVLSGRRRFQLRQPDLGDRQHQGRQAARDRHEQRGAAEGPARRIDRTRGRLPAARGDRRLERALRPAGDEQGARRAVGPHAAGRGEDPQWLAATERAGSIPRVLSPAETEKFAAEQFAVYERLGRQLQIELK